MSENKNNKTKLIIISCIVAVLLALVIFVVVYVNDYYRADDEYISAFMPNATQVELLDDNSIAIIPENPRAGFVFYPGGKVENSAYIPLMKALAQDGIACVIVKMPFNLAVLDTNKADDVIEEFDEIENWYIGGHSLGGSMASTYASKNEDKIKGVVLLASYSTTNLNDTSLDILSIYGSCDKVLNMEKYEQNKENLPNDFTEVVIEGGNHAYFGAYGEQDGDGVARVERTEQIEQSAIHISQFIK